MKRVGIVGAAILGLALLALVVGRLRRKDGPVVARPRPVEAPVAAFASPKVDTSPFVGVIVPRQQVDVSATVEAKVAEIKVQLGSRVAKGDVIATLDAESLRRQRDAAAASVRAAQAQASAASSLAKRMKLAGDAVSGGERAEAQTAAQVAWARVSEAKSQLQQVELLVQSAAVIAPFDGMVSARYVDPGAQVGPGRPLVRVISGDDLWVRFAVPEGRAGEIHLGSCVAAATPSPPVEAAGVVETLAPQVDTELHLLFAEARLTTKSEWKDRMQAGQAASVTVRACTTP